jgi:hypothetical protein
MTTEGIIDHLTLALKKDKALRNAWSANVAMAFSDNYHQFKTETGKKIVSNADIHRISNKAAEHFLKQLCGQIKYPKGRLN